MQLNNRPLILKTVLILAVAACACLGGRPLMGQTQQGMRNLTQTQVRNPLSATASLDISGVPRLDALLQFGQQERLPLGIECLEVPQMIAHISLSTGPESVAKILDLLLPPETGYFWRLEGGVIDISCRKALNAHASLLNLVLRSVSIRQSDMSSAGQSVTTALHAQLYPKQGIAGDYMPGRSKGLVGPFTLHDVTVRDALNRVVSEGPKGVWVARVPPPYLGDLPSAGLWVISAYDDPDFMATARLVREGLAAYPHTTEKTMGPPY